MIFSTFLEGSEYEISSFPSLSTVTQMSAGSKSLISTVCTVPPFPLMMRPSQKSGTMALCFPSPIGLIAIPGQEENAFFPLSTFQAQTQGFSQLSSTVAYTQCLDSFSGRSPEVILLETTFTDLSPLSVIQLEPLIPIPSVWISLPSIWPLIITISTYPGTHI